MSIYFSIHAPRMGSDQRISDKDMIPFIFNSRSLYGERPVRIDILIMQRFFNSRSLYGERRICIFTSTQILNFQFTLPVWGATVVGFPYDFIVLLLFISANQEKAYFFACFFGFFLCVAYGSRRCYLYFSLNGDSFR